MEFLRLKEIAMGETYPEGIYFFRVLSGKESLHPDLIEFIQFDFIIKIW